MNGRRMQGGIAVQSAQLWPGPLWRSSLLLLALLLLGCGHGKAVTQHAAAPDDDIPQPTLQMRKELHRAFAHVAPPQAYAALATLGPVERARADASARQAAVVIPHTFAANKQYTKGVKSGYIGMSADAAITPGDPPAGNVKLTPPTSAFPGSFSYALYRVDGITQTVRTLNVTLGQSSGFVGVAVYNWAYGSLGRWEPRLYAAPLPQVAVALDDLPGADYIDQKGDLAFAVFCLRPSFVTVNSFELSDVTSNQAPFANLFLSSCSGPAPLQTQLNASNSTDDGTIVKYRFDPEGHNQWVDNGNNPILDYTYTTPGPYIPRVEVTDNLGLVTRAAAEAAIVEPATYDEVENDDDELTANPITLPFSLFSGNVGTAGGWDGDDTDWYTFNAAPGDEVEFKAFYCREPGPFSFNMTMALYDSDDQVHILKGSEFNELPAVLYYTIAPDDVGPFYLKVYNGSGFDYSYFLSGGPVQLEQEDNDTPDEVAWMANYFNANLVADKQINGWNGSLGLGPGYQGYDGDDDDWVWFTAAPGITLNVDVDYDNATGNIGATIFNGFGTPVANSADDDGHEHISYTFQPGDSNPMFLHFAALGGTYSDYTVNATLDVPNPGYDETEDNDGSATANQLPAFPFASFTGDVGRGGKYDQDVFDYLKFDSAPGDLLRFTVTPEEPARTGLLLQLIDSHIAPNFSYSPGAEDDFGQQKIVMVPKLSGNTAPYVLVLGNYSYTQPVHYTISGEKVTALDEVEDNDSRAQANPLPGGPLCTFAGNLGGDGDLSDWLTFPAELGEQPEFYLVFDDSSLTFDTNIDPPTIEDQAGDVVAAGFADGQSGAIRLMFQNPIGVNDLSPFYIKINGKTGASNYWIQRTK